MSFRALFLEKNESGFHAGLRELADADLATHAADGNVTVRVAWSTVNYKDGLALTNRSPVVRKWPMVPGIDGAGVVETSDDPRFTPGDTVVLNGWGVGETHWGCLAGKARLKGDWLIALPAGLDAHDAMAIGTAGYTAMLAALALEQGGVRPGEGEVLVTGAAGGVGAGRSRGDRPRHLVNTWKTAPEGALGGRDRRGGVTHTCECLRADEVARCGRGLRACTGHGLSINRCPLHSARCHPGRHRFRDVSASAARGRLAAARKRSRALASGSNHARHRPR